MRLLFLGARFTRAERKHFSLTIPLLICLPWFGHPNISAHQQRTGRGSGFVSGLGIAEHERKRRRRKKRRSHSKAQKSFNVLGHYFAFPAPDGKADRTADYDKYHVHPANWLNKIEVISAITKSSSTPKLQMTPLTGLRDHCRSSTGQELHLFFHFIQVQT